MVNTKQLGQDNRGFIAYLPALIGWLLILVGAVTLVSHVWGNGLILLGIGLLIVGIPGAGSISVLSMKVTGPVGLILIIAGVYLGSVLG